LGEGILSGIFLLNLEAKTLKHTMEQKIIIMYNKYVDAILLLYNSNKIIPKIILEKLNIKHRSIAMAMMQETSNQISCLHLNITYTKHNVEVDIC
jgi:hypothetical protein